MWELALWVWSITNHGMPLAEHEIPLADAWLPETGTQASYEPRLPILNLQANSIEHQSDALHTRLEPPAGAESKVCSINLSESPIALILQELSLQSGVNLVLLAKTDTKLTLRLTKVKLLDMIRHICAMADLAYLKVGEAYVIATPEKLQTAYAKEWAKANPQPEPVGGNTVPPAPIVTDTYMVNYVDDKQIAESLSTFFKDKGLVVVAGPIQVSPSVSSKETAAATGIATGVLDKEVSESGKMLVFRGTREVIDDAIAMAKTMDYARPQVAIYVSIHDITNEAAKELGLSWTYSNLSITEQGTRGINFGSFTRAPLSFVAAIKALEKQDRSKLLASPNIAVLDGERAFILIGNRLNFPVLVGYSQGNTPIFDKQEERVGIYLQVAASVSSDNNITLSLYPQVSSVTGFLEVNGASYPQISTREAQTTLRVTSGETIVMGGMLKDEELQSIEKVPILSELPFFGELFKRRKRTKVSSQVMITITPVLMPAQQ